jgi:hypothetical protein
MLQNTILVCAIVGFIAWYYYQKFQESEREYMKLHKRFVDVCNENVRFKARVRDLQTYKNDVSKTFQILDNELLMINDHIRKQSNTSNTQNPPTQVNANANVNAISNAFSQAPLFTPRVPFGFSQFGLGTGTRVGSGTGTGSGADNSIRNRISILTPDILSNLFSSMNQERVDNTNPNNNPDTNTNANANANPNTHPNTNIDTNPINNQATNITDGTESPVVASVTYLAPGDVFSGNYEQFMIDLANGPSGGNASNAESQQTPQVPDVD